jgi:hypothetical protein
MAKAHMAFDITEILLKVELNINHLGGRDCMAV